jgi:PTH1 family peptidyl-tRNA hydrolase
MRQTEGEDGRKVVVGLGNPGRDYDGTRHNVGFAVVDVLAKSPYASRFQSRFQAQVAELNEDGQRLLLVKPETFMNLSGRAVRQVLDFYHLPPESLLVVCDDMALPLGKLRFRARGSHGGHNGLRDIQNHLSSSEYGRLRIGVGAPEHEAVGHVLGRFRPGERPVIDDAITLAAQAVMVWATRGIEECMNRYNPDPKAERKERKKASREESDNPSASEQGQQ